MKKPFRKIVSLTTMCILCLSACVVSPTAPVTPTDPTQALTLPSSSTPAVTVQTTATFTHTLVALTTTLSPTSIPLAAPPGLMYTSDHALWMIGADGHPMPMGAIPEVSGSPRVQISPDHTMVLYDDWKQCWVVDLAGKQAARITELPVSYVSCQWAPDGKSVYYADGADVWAVNAHAVGERRNVSQTPNRAEDKLLPLWPAHSELLFFYSWPMEVTPDGVGWTGALTTVQTDGTSYQIMAETLSSDTPTYSSGGKVFAYGGENRIWFYHLDTGPQQVDLNRYGLEMEHAQVTSPSWSPDGTQVAGWITGEREGDALLGLLVLDVQAQSAQIVQPVYLPVYWDSHPPAPEWSPDGQWLVYWGKDEAGKRLGVWVVSKDGTQAHALATEDEDEGTCETPWDPGQRQWSPDGQWLVFARCTSISGAAVMSRGIGLTELGRWKIFRVDLPSDAGIVDWIEGAP